MGIHVLFCTYVRRRIQKKIVTRGHNCIKQIPKMHVPLYNHFVQFAIEHCIFNDTNMLQIQGRDLAKEFSDYVGKPIDTRNLFPAIMAQFMKEHPCISRLTSYKGVIYKGIDLQKNITNSKVKPPKINLVFNQPNFTVPNSTAPNSTAPNSTAPNSTAPNSTAPNSTRSNHTTSNSTRLNPTMSTPTISNSTRSDPTISNSSSSNSTRSNSNVSNSDRSTIENYINDID
jgi:hypothetical protein